MAIRLYYYGNKYFILTPAADPSEGEQHSRVLFLNIRNLAGLAGSQPAGMIIQVGQSEPEALVSQQALPSDGIRHEQQVRLVGKPYSMYDDVDYFLAISG